MSKKRVRSKGTTLSVKGKLVGVVTVAGLAEIIGKSVDTVKRYEKLEIFPTAPLMCGEVRYYPVTLARNLVPIVERFRGNRRPEGDDIVAIVKLFNEEREKYATD